MENVLPKFFFFGLLAGLSYWWARKETFGSRYILLLSVFMVFFESGYFNRIFYHFICYIFANSRNLWFDGYRATIECSLDYLSSEYFWHPITKPFFFTILGTSLCFLGYRIKMYFFPKLIAKRKVKSKLNQH